jgi:Tfp pilus assembly protein FimT
MPYKVLLKYGKTPGKEEAFTLLELAVVVLILGITLGMSIPKLQEPIERFRVVTTARQLESDIRSLQQMAISQEYAGFSMTLPTAATPAYSTYKDSVTMKQTVLPAGITMTSNYPSIPPHPPTIYFGLKGLPNRGGTITVQGNKTGEIRYVIIYNVTGRIRIDTVPPPQNY